MEPNAENKLFVGGCPASSGEDDLRELFEKHGPVEEVFVMRGGSRSGMACAFVRFATQATAQAAIDAIHGRITLPDAAEPLVVRWADAPGSRKRENRGNKGRGGGAGPAGPNMGGMDWGVSPMMMANGLYGGYPPMMLAQMGGGPGFAQGAMLQQQAAMNGAFPTGGGPPFYGQPGANGSYGVPNGGMMPQHMGGGYPGPQQQQQLIYLPDQNGMGAHPFWAMNGPPSPGAAPAPGMGPPAMGVPPAMLGAPQPGPGMMGGAPQQGMMRPEQPPPPMPALS